MKKKTTLRILALAGLLGFMPIASQAQSSSLPSTSTTIYDFSNFESNDLLEHFADLWEEGRKYPTDAEIEAWGYKEELEFVRSHTRKRDILSRADRLLQNTYENRELFMNIPSGSGKQTGGYPSKDFANDNYSMWNYTNLFGSWNHSLFQAPGSWTDAAHKNGTYIMAGIKFFDYATGSAASDWANLITTKNSDGSYRYIYPVLNLLRYLGFDGINYNWETGYPNSDVVNFHKQLYKAAAKEGFDDFKIMFYTSSSTLSSYLANYFWGTDPDNRISELMLNYSAGDFSYGISNSVQYAESSMGDVEGLYAGVWIVNMDRRWTALDADEYSHKAGICLWGEHADSRFWSYNTGDDAYQRMDNYQMLLERAFSGGKRNPADRPAVSNTGNNWEWQGDTPPLLTFAGLANWIPERSAISGNLPFCTYFNLGNGDRYNYKGKKTAGSWYNMSNQDVVPTYRWLVYNQGTETVSTAIQPTFTNDDSYTGGSCLELKGTSNASGTDIILYKTSLTPSKGKVYANVAIKTGKEGTTDSKLSLLLRVNGSWRVYPVGSTEGKTWTEKKIDLSDISTGQIIDRIGLRTNDTNSDYSILVGKLEVNDAVQTTPANVTDVTVQVKEETKTSLSVKATWSLDQKPAEGEPMVYNDDANIDHFEILYKNGENGRVSEVGRTSQWATLISDIQLAEDDDPYIGVRAVGTDLKTYSKIDWVQIPRQDIDQLPEAPQQLYGTTELDESAAGADIARAIRYVESFTTEGAVQNLNYHADGPAGNSTNYVDATADHKLIVRQGQTITVHIKGYEATESKDGSNDDLRYCMGKGWLDLNDDYIFNPDDISENPTEGECLFNMGQVRAGTETMVKGNGETYTFTVPEDAKPGPSRLRLVFCDAWFAGGLTPTGKFSKGFAIDFDAEITGDNPGRDGVEDTHDQGIADEPEMIEGGSTTAVVKPQIDGETNVQLTDKGLEFDHVDRVWIFSLDGRLVKTATNPSVINRNELTSGVYLVKTKNGDVVQTQKVTL